MHSEKTRYCSWVKHDAGHVQLDGNVYISDGILGIDESKETEGAVGAEDDDAEAA